jgi:hypothetical protein
MMACVAGSGLAHKKQQKGKRFFFEKKKQKTFDYFRMWS